MLLRLRVLRFCINRLLRLCVLRVGINRLLRLCKQRVGINRLLCWRPTFWRGRNHRFRGNGMGNRLPLNARLLGSRRCSLHRVSGPCWCRCRSGCGRQRIGHRMSVQQRVVFIVLRRACCAGAGEKNVIRIRCGDIVRRRFRLIHSAAGKERFVGLAPHRIREFFGYTFTAGQRTAQDTSAAGFMHGFARRFTFILVLVFVFIFINPGIIATRTVTGKGEDIQYPAAHFLGNAHP